MEEGIHSATTGTSGEGARLHRILLAVSAALYAFQWLAAPRVQAEATA
jgi:hypothetical protein